jgi:pimeloyl-ACP methyl ester carboxylesterase
MPEHPESTGEETSTLQRDGDHHLAWRRRQGATPTILYMGGLGSDMAGEKAEALDKWCATQGQAYVRFDWFGHGLSSGDFTDGGLGRWIADAVAVLDQLTAGPVIAVGSSMGAWAMLGATRARPKRFAGMIAIAAAADFTEDLIWDRMDEDQRLRLSTDGVITPEDPNWTHLVISHHLVRDGRAHLMLRRPFPFTGPVRLMHGLADDVVPWQTSQRLCDVLDGPDVRLDLIKHGDHRLSDPPALAHLLRLTAEVVEAVSPPKAPQKSRSA